KGIITMKKRLIMILIAILLIFILVACVGNKVDDSKADNYITQAEKIVDLLNESNYEDVHSMFNEEMEASLPIDDMRDLSHVFEESGSFEEISKASVEEKDDLYVTVLVAKYSDENRIFTITFNGDEEVAGLFIK